MGEQEAALAMRLELDSTRSQLEASRSQALRCKNELEAVRVTMEARRPVTAVLERERRQNASDAMAAAREEARFSQLLGR